MDLNIKQLSADVQTLLELRENFRVTIDALRLCDGKDAADLVARFEKYVADLDTLIEKLASGTAEPAEAAHDPAPEVLLAPLQVQISRDHPDNLAGGCTFPLPADTAGRGPKRA